MRLIRNGAIGVLILFLTGFTLLLVTHEGRVVIKTGFLVADALTEGGRPAPPFTSEPISERIEYPFAGGKGAGTLYRPPDTGKHGAVIMMLGINANLQDELLHRFAVLLSRQGVVVLVVEPQQLKTGRLSHEEVESLIGAFRFLQAAPHVEPKRVGFAGFCVGASLALIAAADPRISSDVKFVNFFGGYYSARDLVAEMTTHQLRLEGGSFEPWKPNADAEKWMADQLIQAVPATEERALLNRVARSGGASDSERAALSIQGQVVYDALANRDPARAGGYYSRLPLSVREALAQLSPEGQLDWLQAKVYIMHDREDTYVPYVESRRLWSALALYPRKHLTEFAIFQHMYPNRAVEPAVFLNEAAKLYSHLYLLMLEIS